MDQMNGFYTDLNGHSNGFQSSHQDDHQTKLESFRKMDAERDAFVQELLRSYQDLRERFTEKCNDFENEKVSRRMWQERADMAQRNSQAIQRNSDINPFVLVLIDGDGAVFLDHLYRAATEGGGDAAHQLSQEVKRHIAELYPHENTSGWNIIANVFCNVEGLVAKLKVVGVLRSPTDFPQFARAFGLNQSLFNMIDVGAGKERADYKLRAALQLFLPNMHCKHVVLGGISHDNGYLPMLEPLKRDHKISSRITLLETYPAQPAYQALGFRMFQCPNIFRTEQLPMRYEQQMTLPQRSMPPPAPAMQTPAVLPPIAPPKPSISTPPSAPATVASPSPAASADSSWATVSKKPGNVKEINLATKKGPQQKFMLFNRHDERLDPELPKADQAAVQRMFDRINKSKVCNAYHLNGNCDKGEYTPIPY